MSEYTIARVRITEIEEQWAHVVGVERFETACAVMQELLDALDPGNARR